MTLDSDTILRMRNRSGIESATNIGETLDPTGTFDPTYVCCTLDPTSISHS